MKKGFAGLVPIWVLLIALCACGADDAPDTSAISLPDDSSTVLPVPAPAEALYPEGQLRLCEAQGNTMWFSSVLNTGQGYYELVVQDDGPEDYENEVHTLIQRIDYATRQSSPLCSREGCAHNGEDCSAWLPGHYSDYHLLEADGRLVLVDVGACLSVFDEETGMFTETYTYRPAIVYTMDYDGQNRAELCRLEERQTLWSARWATDDACLYGVRSEGPPVQDEQTIFLIRIDLASGEISELCQMNPFRGEYLTGVLDGKLLTVGSPSTEAEREEWTDDDYFEEPQAFFTVDTKTGQKTQLPSEVPNMTFGSFGSYCQEGEYIYYCPQTFGIDPEAEEEPDEPWPIYKMNLYTGETSEWSSLAPGTKGDVGRLVDGKLEMHIHYLAQNGLIAVRYLWLDTSTRQETEQSLYKTVVWYPSESPEDSAVLPEADAGDYYLVIIGVQNSPGTTKPDYALILKEDYWAGKANYIPIVEVG